MRKDVWPLQLDIAFKEMLKVIVRVMLIFFKNDFINLWIAFSSFNIIKGERRDEANR